MFNAFHGCFDKIFQRLRAKSMHNIAKQSNNLCVRRHNCRFIQCDFDTDCDLPTVQQRCSNSAAFVSIQIHTAGNAIRNAVEMKSESPFVLYDSLRVFLFVAISSVHWWHMICCSLFVFNFFCSKNVQICCRAFNCILKIVSSKSE